MRSHHNSPCFRTENNVNYIEKKNIIYGDAPVHVHKYVAVSTHSALDLLCVVAVL